MDGILEDVVGGAAFHDVAHMHDADVVRDVFDHRQVVGDEEVGNAHLVLQVPHQVDHLRLNGDVQRADAFIGDDQLGPEHQRPGNADALALAARELAGVAGSHLGGDAHLLQDLVDLFFPLGLGSVQVMGVQPLGDDIHHLFAGVQAGHRVLKDHLHIGAQLAAGGGAELAVDAAVKLDLTGGGVVQTDDAPARGALAAAALAYQAVGLALRDGKGDVVHRLDGEVAPRLKILFQMADAQQRFLFHHLPPLSSIRAIFSCRDLGISTLGASGWHSQEETRCLPPTLNWGGAISKSSSSA